MNLVYEQWVSALPRRTRSWKLAAATLVSMAALGALTLPRASSASGPARALKHGLALGLSDRAADAAKHITARRAADARQAHLARSIRRMPDLTQTAADLALPGGGSSYCGPVAVSNALAGLAQAGTPRLLPDRPTPRGAQLALVRQLGSGRYMGTGANSGTGAAGLMVGLERYLRDRGFAAELSYQGWRGHPRRFSSGIKVPSQSAMVAAFETGASVFVNIGWYAPSPRVPGVYRRRGGHWLTLVGTGTDPRGDRSPETLVFHDPAPWAGEEGARHFASLEALGGGWLITEEGPFASSGHHILRGVHVKHPGDVAIVDGMVSLKVTHRASAANPE